MKKICDNCKWWIPNQYYRDCGTCKRITDNSDDAYIEHTEDSLVFLHTDEEFGCNLWKEKEGD